MHDSFIGFLLNQEIWLNKRTASVISNAASLAGLSPGAGVVCGGDKPAGSHAINYRKTSGHTPKGQLVGDPRYDYPSQYFCQ